MKLTSTLLLLLAFPAIVIAKETEKPAILQWILNGIMGILRLLKSGNIDSIAQPACDGFINGIGLENSMNCACTGRLLNGFNLVKGDLACAAASDACVSDSFCGSVALEASVVGGFGRKVTGDVTACLAGAAPHDIGDMDVCITGVASGVTPGAGFDSCKATMNNQACTCTPCNGKGFSVTFDCSMVNISPLVVFPVRGPKVGACQMLDFTNSD